MSFTTPCFIRKNTPELRDKLRELGYKVFTSFSNYPCLATMPDDGIVVPATDINRNRLFDCEDNEDLFIALAALRDDSDYMQWFIGEDIESNLGQFFLCTENKMPTSPFQLGAKRKATPTEIIAHFKQKES